MMRTFSLFLLAASILLAQPSAKTELMKLTDKLDAAIQAGDWPEAVQLSRTLRGAVEEARNQSMSAAGFELAESILNWLPADTATLVTAQQPFTIQKSDQTKSQTALSMARGYVLGLLGAAEKKKLSNGLLGRTVRLAALGAREPAESELSAKNLGLGMMPYQGCAVYAFTEPVPESIFERPPDETIIEHHVWISKGSQNDAPDITTYFVTFLKPDVMLVCNSRAYFQETIARVASPSKPRALPNDLPEWKQVDRSAPLWAICHYRWVNMITSQLSRNGQLIWAPGLTVELGLASDAVKARIQTKSDPWKPLVGSPDSQGAAKSSEVAPGVWELSVQGNPHAGGFAVFALMGLLGFMVAI